MKETALVVFKKSLTSSDVKRLSKQHYDVVVAPRALQDTIGSYGLEWVSLEDMVEPGSIYEANTFVKQLSQTKLPDGTLVAKSCVYKGYELWWMYYNRFFLNFGLPYTQHKKLLTYVKDFNTVHFYQLRFQKLFLLYLEAYGCKTKRIHEPGLRDSALPSFGILLQIAITIISLPILVLKRKRILFFTGDKFEKTRDYDLRMGFVYKELRERKLPFVEFVRSLESWKTVYEHARTRKRPVIYSEAVASIGRGIGLLGLGKIKAQKKYDVRNFGSVTNPEERFMLLVSTRFLLQVHHDIWAIRIMRFIIKGIGIRAAFFTAVLERNLHTVLGCKLQHVPTVGVLHGVASCDYNVYDFMPGFDGAQSLTVDTYGMWSAWWKEYYLKHGRAYTADQLVVSGPMRPAPREESSAVSHRTSDSLLKVLFISEQLAIPEEVLPFLRRLIAEKNIELFIKFRPYRDGFETWLTENHPDILSQFPQERILRSDMKTAIAQCDVVVGSHSTAVLEALLSQKPIAFFATKKWGDYFSLTGYSNEYSFYDETPEAFIASVHKNRNVPESMLLDLQERFFGDPYQNGSAWVVDQLVSILEKNK